MEKKRRRDEEDEVTVRETAQIIVHQKPKVSFILDNAAITKAFIKKKWVVANGIDDEAALRRQNKNPDHYMSHITHLALKEILDSPLNKYGLVGAIFVKIANGVLFEVKPHVRIPRTLPRFNGLMCISKSSLRLVDVADYVNATSDARHLVFVVGVSTSEEINQRYVRLDDIISVTDYPVDATASIDLICGACEEKWMCF